MLQVDQLTQFNGQRRQLIAAQIERLQAGQLAQFGRQHGQLVVPQVERLQAGQLAQFRRQRSRQPVFTQVQVFQGGQASHFRRDGPGQKVFLQIQVAQAGELPQLRRQRAGQKTRFRRGHGAVFNMPPGGVSSVPTLVSVSQVQVFQVVELAQFRQEGAAEVVEIVGKCTQSRHAPVRIQGHKVIALAGRCGAPLVCILGDLNLHGWGHGGQEGLAEPVGI